MSMFAGVPISHHQEVGGAVTEGQERARGAGKTHPVSQGKQQKD